MKPTEQLVGSVRSFGQQTYGRQSTGRHNLWVCWHRCWWYWAETFQQQLSIIIDSLIDLHSDCHVVSDGYWVLILCVTVHRFIEWFLWTCIYLPCCRTC